MKIRVDTQEKDFPQPVTVEEVLKELLPGVDALGAFSNGRVLELGCHLEKDCELEPITYAHEEGRRIYERSLRFVLILAAYRLFPERTLRFEHSLGTGVYVRFLDGSCTPEDTERLQNEMKSIVQSDMPFVKQDCTKQEAIDYFASLGMQDKVKLLSYRPEDHFHVYSCGDMKEYFYGPMLPSTGRVRVFGLHLCAEGFVMLLPCKYDAATLSEPAELPMHLQAFRLSNYWCRVLKCSNAADLNDMIAEGRYREFIRVNEALQDKAIADIAESIHARKARAIFIAGPSSSGKTTFANRLSIHLRVLGYTPKMISLDDFYRNRADLIPEENGQPDLEALDALDVPLIRECIGKLLRGEEAPMPRFDFHSQSRLPERVPMKLRDGEILLVEGIHGLNPALHQGFERNDIFKVFITELTCLNLDDHNRIRTTDARLLRRVVRDYQFRGTKVEDTLAMWKSVRAGEDKWIFPYQEQADVVINSALHYELPLLRTLALDALRNLERDNVVYPIARRMIKILRYFLPAPEEAYRDIPPTSIVREFVGGNTFYEE